MYAGEEAPRWNAGLGIALEEPDSQSTAIPDPKAPEKGVYYGEEYQGH